MRGDGFTPCLAYTFSKRKWFYVLFSFHMHWEEMVLHTVLKPMHLVRGNGFIQYLTYTFSERKFVCYRLNVGGKVLTNHLKEVISYRWDEKTEKDWDLGQIEIGCAFCHTTKYRMVVRSKTCEEGSGAYHGTFAGPQEEKSFLCLSLWQPANCTNIFEK